MIVITDLDNHTDEFIYDEDYLLVLLETSSYEGERREDMERRIEDKENMTEETYNEILHSLLINQMDRISSGFNYSMTDLKRHLKKFM